MLSLALIAASAGGPDWTRIEAPRPVASPRDEGAHPDVRTEWWYVTGELVDDAGATRGFQVTVFRQGLDAREPGAEDAPLRARHALAAHVVLVDVAEGRTRRVERLRRIGAGLAWASEERLDVGLEDVTIARSAEGRIAVAAGAREAGFALDLELGATKPLVLHGESGLSRKGPEPGNASMYATIPRLAVRGTLELDGRALAVRGEAWLDHEWGTSQLGPGVVGWDWTGLRLDDGRELMLYRLRSADGSVSPFSSGTLVERDGTTRRLASGDFELEPLATWTSAATKARYPIRWRVSVPSASIAGELSARVDDCEIDARRSTGTIYWEGPARLAGAVAGSGYLELSGYASSLAGRF